LQLSETEKEIKAVFGDKKLSLNDGKTSSLLSPRVSPESSNLMVETDANGVLGIHRFS
jgi:hypothetical protein